MNPMNDDQRIDEALRHFLKAHAEDLAGLAVGEFEMADRVRARVGGRHMDRRMVLLVAAALLLIASMAATAFAVASGRLRLPWASEFTPGAYPSCGYDAPPGLVLYYDDHDFLVTLDSSGRLIRGTNGEGNVNLTIRTLTARGIGAMIDEVQKTLPVSGCHTISVPGGQDHGLYLETRSGVVGMSWGPNRTTVRPTSPAELAAINVLQARLDDVASWMPADGWVDATPQAYLPDRWDIGILLIGTDGPKAPGPDPAALTMPDGSDVGSFGTVFPPASARERCGTVTPAFVSDLLDRFAVLGVQHDGSELGKVELADASNRDWALTDHVTGEGVQIDIRGLRPHDADCVTRAQIAQTQSDAHTDPRIAVNPCNLLPAGASSSQGENQLTGIGTVGFRDCQYFQGNNMAILSWRSQPTSPVDGRRIAHELFGTALVEKEVDGHEAFLNACFEPAAACSPAIAISADPYFFVISVSPPFTADRTEIETLGRLMIEGLPQP